LQVKTSKEKKKSTGSRSIRPQMMFQRRHTAGSFFPAMYVIPMLSAWMIGP